MICTILLHWQNTEDILQMIKLLQSWEDVHIVVVDQTGTLGLPDAARLKVITPMANVGYGAGCNLGIRWSIAHHMPYTLLLNTDITLRRSDLDELLDRLDTDDTCFVIAPVLKEFKNGAWQYSCGGQDPLGLRQTRIWHSSVQHLDRALDKIIYLPGTALLTKTTMFETYGLLDEEYFFGGEWADYFIAHLNPARYSLATEVIVPHTRDHTSVSPDRIYYNLRNRYRIIDRFATKNKWKLKARWSLALIRQYLGALTSHQRANTAAISHAIIDGLCRSYGAREKKQT